MKCKQCDDNIIIEGEGCAKCANQLCGSCCECECEGDGCSNCTVFCGDCLTPIVNCGCKI